MKNCTICGLSLTANKHPNYLHHRGACHRQYLATTPRPPICTWCGEEYTPLTKQPNTRHHRGECHRALNREYHEKRKLRPPRENHSPCRDCGCNYSPNLWYSPLLSYCKVCQCRRSKDRYYRKVKGDSK